MINCTFEDGRTGHLRHVVVDNIITKNSKILLVKRAARLLEGGKWALPGGYMDRDETSLSAAEREAQEETGWKLKDTKLFMIEDSPNRPNEDRQNISLVFISTVADKIGEADDESDAVEWFPLDQLPVAAQIAFDHAEIIEQYKKYLKQKHPLPIF